MLDKYSVLILKKLLEKDLIDDDLTELVPCVSELDRVVLHLETLKYVTGGKRSANVDTYHSLHILPAGRAALENHRRESFRFWIPIIISLFALLRPEIGKLFNAILKLLGQ